MFSDSTETDGAFKKIKVQRSMFYQGKNNTIYPVDNISDDTLLGLHYVPQYRARLLASQSVSKLIKMVMSESFPKLIPNVGT